MELRNEYVMNFSFWVNLYWTYTELRNEYVMFFLQKTGLAVRCAVLGKISFFRLRFLRANVLLHL